MRSSVLTTCAVLLLQLLASVRGGSSVVEILVIANYPGKNLGPSDHMTVRGSGCGINWNTGMLMTVVGENQWTYTIQCPGTLVNTIVSVKILVNDQVWMVGSNAEFVVPAETGNMVNIYPWFNNQPGRYQYMYGVWSPQLNNTRNLVIYTPPSYYENTLKPFNPAHVLLMHDGQNLFNVSTSAFGVAWMCQTTLNLLIPEGDMEEIIIVGIDNTANRTFEYTYSWDPTVCTASAMPCGGASYYLDFIEETVIPIVLENFRITYTGDASDNLNRWGILGSSLGGILSCYAGWTRPTVYGTVGCMSSSFWWNFEDFNTTILKTFHGVNDAPANITVYLDSGNAGPDDDDCNETRVVRNHMESIGFVINESISLSSVYYDKVPILNPISQASNEIEYIDRVHGSIHPNHDPLTQCISSGPSATEPLSSWLDKAIYYYLDVGGQHNEFYWGSRFHVPMAYLFPVTPLPTTPRF